ncbi:hypothetical protein OAB57_03815 [Bacteriovoracaceae bacterium]|nr:hypothetical protein [Bacteriovoracaceae bacterium]
MVPKINEILILLSILPLMSCNNLHELSKKEHRAHQFKVSALALARDNRLIKAKIGELEFKIQTLNAKNNFLVLSLKNTRNELRKTRVKLRAPASNTHSKSQDSKINELVGFSTYKWKPQQMIAMAQNSFYQKDFDKSSKFFYSFFQNYPEHELATDKNLFIAGIAAYKSGTHYEWAINFLTMIIAEFPNSKYYRGAKLWIALSQHQMGNDKFFYKTMEEFRLKYRNTSEWKILSAYYENFRNKFKR